VVRIPGRAAGHEEICRTPSEFSARKVTFENAIATNFPSPAARHFFMTTTFALASNRKQQGAMFHELLCGIVVDEPVR
jgi:hypothetical protein